MNNYRYMCPHCFRLSEEERYDHICLSGPDNSQRGKRNKCSIELDAGIAQGISELNKKGYKTTFCCEGHSDGSSIAYITFDPSMSLEAIEDLCSGFNIWEFDTDNYQNSSMLRMQIPHKVYYDESLNKETYEVAFDYYKQLYLHELNEVVEYLEPIDIQNIEEARPVVTGVVWKENFPSCDLVDLKISTSLFLINQSRKKYNKLTVGSTCYVNGIKFTISSIEIKDSLYLIINAVNHSESIRNIESMVDKLYGKQIKFPLLGDKIK